MNNEYRVKCMTRFGNVFYSQIHTGEFAIVMHVENMLDILTDTVDAHMIVLGVESMDEYSVPCKDVDLSKDKFFSLEPMKKVEHLEYLMLNEW